MGLLGSILKTTIDIATTPVDILKDFATMGGALTEEDRPYTFSKGEKINDDIKKVVKKIEEL